MASVQTFTLPHYDAYPVHVALFKDVTNAAFLRSQLLEANPEFDYAFLDASMVSNLVVHLLIMVLYSALFEHSLESKYICTTCSCGYTALLIFSADSPFF